MLNLEFRFLPQTCALSVQNEHSARKIAEAGFDRCQNENQDLRMKVTRNTENQLIVANIPWLLGLGISVFILIFVGIGLSLVIQGEMMGFLFAIIGGGVGAGCFVGFVRRTQIIFDRPSNQILIRRRSVFGYSQEKHVLSELEHVELESTRNSDGQTLYRPVMVFRSGKQPGNVPVVLAYTNTRGPQRITDSVNAWLAGNIS